jgi:transcriptional regulator with XRE-family HTH domain
MLSGVKTDERRRARELRIEGWSVKDIERELGVSRSSVSIWVRDVELTTEQRRRLIARSRLGPIVAGPKKAAAAREVRRSYQEHGRELARERGALYAAGCMLYWAEGAKGRNAARLTNSDPEVLAFLAGFLREEFSVPDTAMTFRCNLFADHLARVHEIEDFWLATWPSAELPAQVDRQQLLEVQPEEATEQAAVRHRRVVRPQHADRADDLRVDPGVRRLRSSRVARLTRSESRAQRDGQSRTAAALR